MSKRPSLFGTAAAKAAPAVVVAAAPISVAEIGATARPPSRAGKRVLSVYLEQEAWKQLRALALDEESTTQALGVEAVNMLFAARGKNRIA